MTSAPRPAAAVAVIAGVAVAFMAAPLAGLLWRTPWTELGELAAAPGFRAALRLSLVTSVLATLTALVLGLPLAWLLARHDFPGRRLVRAMALVPLVLPPVVGGVALLLAYGRRGLIGQWLDQWFGITLPFTTAGAVVAEAFVALPFVVLTAEGAFRSLDHRYEDAARTLGARRRTVFRQVTVPLLGPAMVAAAVLAWARALGEFGATITFAGSASGRTTTVPLEVYVLLESGDLDGAIVLSIVLLVVSVAILVGLRDRWTPSW